MISGLGISYPFFKWFTLKVLTGSTVVEENETAVASQFASQFTNFFGKFGDEDGLRLKSIHQIFQRETLETFSYEPIIVHVDWAETFGEIRERDLLKLRFAGVMEKDPRR